jgi:hypothetical protein
MVNFIDGGNRSTQRNHNNAYLNTGKNYSLKMKSEGSIQVHLLLNVYSSKGSSSLFKSLYKFLEPNLYSNKGPGGSMS